MGTTDLSDSIIFYQPRLRVWRDGERDWHVAGEPDGFNLLLKAFRTVSRGVRRRACVALRTEPIPEGRNPVTVPVVKMCSKIYLEFARREQDLHLLERGAEVRLTFSRTSGYRLAFAIHEALDGVGDFCVPITTNAEPSFLWFWGYANVHGVNSF